MTKTNRIYFDNAATTPLLPEVIAEINYIAENFYGNPSSIHSEGVRAKSYIEECRRSMADFIGCSPGQLFFTSCGTESNNMILHSAVRDYQVKSIISSPIEHSAILNVIEYLQSEYDLEVHWLRPNHYGNIDLNELETTLKIAAKPALVSLMHVNNELGSLLDLDAVSKLCKQYDALFHSDTVQSVGMYDVQTEKIGLDFICGSAHKLHGPKGVGFLYMSNPGLSKPFIHGGGQERKMRGGTENIIGIGAMTKAFNLWKLNREERKNQIINLNRHLRKRLMSLNKGIECNSDEQQSHPKILNVYIPEFTGIEMLLINLDIKGIAVSGGSACSSGAEKVSHVMEYIRPSEKGKNIRFSFSHLNTIAEIDQMVEALMTIL